MVAVKKPTVSGGSKAPVDGIDFPSIANFSRLVVTGRSSWTTELGIMQGRPNVIESVLSVSVSGALPIPGTHLSRIMQPNHVRLRISASTGLSPNAAVRECNPSWIAARTADP